MAGSNGNGHAPSTNGNSGNGKDPTNGRFLPGNRLGGNNPYTGKLSEWRRIFVESVTADDLRAVLKSVVKAAGKGDMAAAKLYLERVLGKVPDVIVTDESARQLIAVIRGVEVDV